MMRSRFFFTTINRAHPYDAVLEYATAQSYTLPSAPQQILQRQFVSELVAQGIWRKLDILYVFATDGDGDFARINWISPGSFTAIDGSSTAPTFTTNGGFTFTLPDGFINTQWIPATHAGKMVLGDGGVFCHINNDYASGGYAFGSQDVSGQGSDTISSRIYISPRTDDDYQYAVNSSNAGTTGDLSSSTNGFFHAYQVGSSDHRLFRDSVEVAHNTNNLDAIGMPTKSIHLGIVNVPTGVGKTMTEYQMSMMGVGKSLSNKTSELYAAWNSYFTSL